MLLSLSQKRKQLISLLTSGDSGQSTDVKVEMQKFKATFGDQRLSLDDLSEAETSIVRFSQLERFPDEIAALSSGKFKVGQKPVSYVFSSLRLW